MKAYTSKNENGVNELVLKNKCENFTGDQDSWNISKKSTGTNIISGNAIDMFAQYEKFNTLRPIVEWQEDYGTCLFWRVPIEEPPYCGSPLDSKWEECNFAEYYTHFTRIMNPINCIDLNNVVSEVTQKEKLISSDELIERIEEVLSRREHRQAEVPSWLQKIIDELPPVYNVEGGCRRIGRVSRAKHSEQIK